MDFEFKKVKFHNNIVNNRTKNWVNQTLKNQINFIWIFNLPNNNLMLRTLMVEIIELNSKFASGHKHICELEFVPATRYVLVDEIRRNLWPISNIADSLPNSTGIIKMLLCCFSINLSYKTTNLWWVIKA